MTAATVRAVLFDMDGVLIDSYGAWRGVVDDTRVHFGHAPLADEEFAAGWGQGMEQDVAAWFPGQTQELVAAVYHERFPHHVAAIAPIAGARELLGGLVARGVRCACVTNTPGTLARTILERLELAPHLDPILGGDEVAASKPAPDLIHAALARLQLEVDDAWFVGDTGNDVAAAAAAGIRLIGFRQDAGQRVDELHAIPALLGH